MLEDAEDVVDNTRAVDIPTVKKVKRDQDAKIFGKTVSVEQLDPFFEEAQADETIGVEKRAVMRDGRIPMLQKNVERA